MWLLIIGVVAAYYLLRYLWELVEIPDLRKRAIFVSGADSGFGQLLALKCAANGMPVFAGCLTSEGIESLTRKASGLPGDLHAIPLNVCDQRSVDNAREYVSRHLDGGKYLWAVVNNAGIFQLCLDAWSDMSDLHDTVDVNLYGAIRVTHAFLPMLKQTRGRIVSMSSVLGRYSLPGTAAYSISKYGCEAYMDSIRRELRPFGIRCSILEPGNFKTPLADPHRVRKDVDKVWGRMTEDLRSEYGEEFKEELIRRTYVAFDTLASDRLDYVVDNYYHAIAARWPRARYRCGWDANLLLIPITFLPTEVEDFVFRCIWG